MIFLVDIGNSRIKWGRAEAGGVAGAGAAHYGAEDLERCLDAAWSGCDRPARVVACSVGGGEVRERLRAWIDARWGVDCEIVATRRRGFGVTCAYDDPRRLGSDRWAALVAARHRVAGPACIVDCGTAITVDAISATGEHLGGLIAPGAGLMRRALTRDTKEIGEVDVEADALLERSTPGAVSAGSFHAAVAFVDRAADGAVAALGGEAHCVITGGEAPRLLPALARAHAHRPWLVLEGLAVIAAGDA